MLGTLISSKTKRLILNQFLSHPDKKLYLRQIAAGLGISVGTAHRELNKLEENGILLSENLGNLRLFSVNKASPIFHELKQIIFKTEGIQGALEKVFGKIKGVKAAFIYGSFARGKENINSDVDLFIAGNIDEDDLVSRISELERKFQREFNYTIYSPRELKGKMKKKDSFVSEVLSGQKIFIFGRQKDLDGA